MIAVSLVDNVTPAPISFNSGIDSYKFLEMSGHFLHQGLITTQTDLNLLDLTSKNKKVYMIGGVGPYHLIFDNIFSIMDLNEKNPGIEFIVDTCEIEYKKNMGFVDFIKDNLGNHINIRFISTQGYDGVRLNNYCLFDNSIHTTNFDRQSIEKNLQTLIKDRHNVEKRVYVSRNKFEFYSHTRISKESELEDFFVEHGFEIVYPEDFKSIREQIDFFGRVKTIASLSSSGLSWSVFMQPGGNVLELQTAFPNIPDAEFLHHQYQAISYSRDLNYYSIPNHDKLSESLIDKIKDSKILSII